MKEGSARYKAVQTAGTLGDEKWNYFRRARCGSDATEMPAPTPAVATPATQINCPRYVRFYRKSDHIPNAPTHRKSAKCCLQSAHVSDHARLMTVRGEVMQGKMAIEKGLPAIFASRATNANLRTFNYKIRFTPDVALVYVSNEPSAARRDQAIWRS
jgi:hypothetical protein